MNACASTHTYIHTHVHGVHHRYVTLKQNRTPCVSRTGGTEGGGSILKEGYWSVLTRERVREREELTVFSAGSTLHNIVLHALFLYSSYFLLPHCYAAILVTSSYRKKVSCNSIYYYSYCHWLPIMILSRQKEFMTVIVLTGMHWFYYELITNNILQ